MSKSAAVPQNHQRQRAHSRLGEAGMVSIMVTLVMMMVISLIVIGFADVSRRNAREEVDRELSAQAYNAAETGINDAIRDLSNPSSALAAGLNGGAYDTDCSAAIGVLAAKSGNATYNSLNPTAGGQDTRYTCLLLNNHPNFIPTSAPLGGSMVVPLNMTNSDGTLTFEWSNTTSAAPTNCGGGNIFKPNTVAGWNCSYGVLRVDLFQDDGVANDPTSMAKNASTIYFVPRSAGGTGTAVTLNASTTPSAPTIVTNSKCNSATCTATVNIAAGNVNYYARLGSIYNSAGNVKIKGGPATIFNDSGVLIDATGKAQDVLRRVQVRVQISGNSVVEIPSSALQSSGALCKRFTIVPNDPAGDGANPDFNDATTPLCLGAPPTAFDSGPANNSPFASIAPINGPGNGSPSWNAGFLNTSSYTAAQVASCVWDFGDGTTATDQCTGGSSQHHSFPTNGNNSTCYIRYQINLTITLNDGTVATAKAQSFMAPQPNTTHQPC